MKIAFEIALSLLFLCVSSSLTMGKRVLVLEEQMPLKKVKSAPLSEAEKKYLSERQEQIKQVPLKPIPKQSKKLKEGEENKQEIRSLNKVLEQSEEDKYSKRFYYVPGVSRAVALKYCQAIGNIQSGFNHAWSACENFENGFYAKDSKTRQRRIANMRSFVRRYSQAVIAAAYSLRSFDLKPEEIGQECAKAIEHIHTNGTLLKYILLGKKNRKATLMQLELQWKRIAEQLQPHEDSTVSEKE